MTTTTTTTTNKKNEKHHSLTIASEKLKKLRHPHELKNGRGSTNKTTDAHPRKAKIASSDAHAVKNPEEDVDMITATDNDNLTKIQFQFFEAARTNRCDILSMILDQRACRVDVRNNLDRTALHLAAAQGFLEAVQMLVDANAPVDNPDKHGMSPMFWAAYHDHVDIVIFLIGKGANINRRTKRGLSLLHVLAKTDSLRTLEMLVRNMTLRNFNDLDMNDNSPLMTATAAGSLRAATVLSRIGSLEPHIDKNQRNVFHLAVIGGCPFVLDQLCHHEDTPKLINAFDASLMAPIHHAIELDDYDCMTILLKYGARVNIKSKSAPYPIITAAQRGTVDMINLLISHKAKISKTNFAGNTPLHISCIANQVEAVRFFLRKGANMSALNRRLQTPFNAAVEQDSADAAELLILAGARMDEVDRAAKKPLAMAAVSGFVRIVDMIIKAERWRSANPETAAQMAKKYYRPQDYVEEDQEEGEKLGLKEEDGGEAKGSREIEDDEVSVSQASTFVSTDQDGIHTQGLGEDSISEASTYRSGDSGGSGENCTLKDDQGSQRSNLSTEDPLAPPTAQTTPGKTVLTASTASRGQGSAHERLTERLRLQRARRAPPSLPRAPQADSSHPSVAPSTRAKEGPPTPALLSTNRGPPTNEPTNTYHAASIMSIPPTPDMPSNYSSVFEPEYRFLVSNQPYAGSYQNLFFNLAHKKLRPGEWKSLGKHWNFTEEHILAIEQQHFGSHRAYRQHGYRLLCIWMHGLSNRTNPSPALCTALIAIGRPDVANHLDDGLHVATHGRRPSSANSGISALFRK